MIRDRLRTSETRDGRRAATWRLDGSVARILRVQLRYDASSAYQWPHTPLPAGSPGLILCDDARTPDLPEARALLPQHADLWDRVRSDRLAAVFNVCEDAKAPDTEPEIDVRKPAGHPSSPGAPWPAP